MTYISMQRIQQFQQKDKLFIYSDLYIILFVLRFVSFTMLSELTECSSPFREQQDFRKIYYL